MIFLFSKECRLKIKGRKTSRMWSFIQTMNSFNSYSNTSSSIRFSGIVWKASSLWMSEQVDMINFKESTSNTPMSTTMVQNITRNNKGQNFHNFAVPLIGGCCSIMQLGSKKSRHIEITIHGLQHAMNNKQNQTTLQPHKRQLYEPRFQNRTKNTNKP
jgi:hypothetical protein